MNDTALTILTAPWAARAVTAATRVGVIDKITEKPGETTDLAEALGLDTDVLARLMRLLEVVGLVERQADGYVLTEAGRPLSRDHPRSVRLLAELYEERYFVDAWRSLETGLQSGRSPFIVAHETSVFEYLAQHPEIASRYAEAMSAGSRFGDCIPAAVELGDSARVVDVGGGDGSVLISILALSPNARGALVDLPEVIPRARKAISAAGQSDRVDYVAGDFFEPGTIPAGGDIYLLSRVLHNWSDQDCVRILRAIRSVMNAGAQVIVIERMIPPSSSTPLEGILPILFDMHMFVMTEGRERTEEEYLEIFAQAKLRALPIKILPLGFSLMAGTDDG